jgi:hypothetical protein
MSSDYTDFLILLVVVFFVAAFEHTIKP